MEGRRVSEMLNSFDGNVLEIFSGGGKEMGWWRRWW